MEKAGLEHAHGAVAATRCIAVAALKKGEEMETKEAGKHTPGPWRCEARDEMVHSCIEDKVSKEDFPYQVWVPSPPFVLGATGALVARTDSGYSAEANARLIAAAPELLEACKIVLEFYEPYLLPRDFQRLKEVVRQAEEGV